jgi:tRNA A37 threonylcarbamoyladenosine synthetase subunit TsaC/SUA5/YrdC
MSRVPHHSIALVLIVVGGGFMAMSSVAAQPAQPPRTSVEIQAQVQKSAELQPSSRRRWNGSTRLRIASHGADGRDYKVVFGK